MYNPYVKDLSWEVVLKLEVNDVFLFSSLSAESNQTIDKEFWMSKFIRDFGSNLPNGTDYEEEYLAMKELKLEELYRYVISKYYIKLLLYMLSIWKVPDDMLILAAKNGHLDIIKILLANGASIHDQEDEALIIAAENGQLDMVKLLLANGASIHARNDLALGWAAQNGHLEIVKLLLANGASIHAENDFALRSAAYNGRLEIVKLLLTNGADIHAQKDSTLRSAARKGHLEIVKFL